MMWTENRESVSVQVTDLCRRRLLNLSDSLMELAKSYRGETAEAGTRQETLAEARLREGRQVMSCQLGEMARIMTGMAGNSLEYRPLENRRARKLISSLQEEGIAAKNPVYVQGESGEDAVLLTMCMQARGRDSVVTASASEVTDMISVLLNRRLKLSGVSPLVIEQESHSFLLEPEPKYLALTGFSRVAKEGETVSGDNYAVLEPRCGQMKVLLSDGTGSGEKAGEDSEQVLDLMEKFWEAGYETGQALRMVNDTFLVLGTDDNHPTLDICELDLYHGSMRLSKVGGAVSFLKSADRVEILGEGNLPLGILGARETTPINRLLQEGDCIVMVTDGVVEAFGKQMYEQTLAAVLEGLREESPEETAQRLLRAALIAGDGHVRDDMTVGVIRIYELNPEND